MCNFFKYKKSFPLLISFFIGIAVGFVISPVKKGIAIFSYNGNYTNDSGTVKKNLDKLDE